MLKIIFRLSNSPFFAYFAETHYLTPILNKYQYYFLFTLLAGVYVAGLFVPLMDNDAAHHANIALHMHLTGDYVSLIDNGKDYLDKPHFHFWLVSLSYKLFGVNGFAYKLPSFLFTVGGVYSTYRLGKSIFGEETGRLAALILASSCAFILANNDVRMDAVLTASIIFSIWQLTALIKNKKSSNAVLAALGLAMGFSTKGHIGIIIPAVSAIAFIAEQKAWRIFITRQWWLMLLLSGILIIPELYCYYLQFNMHPEKIIRGRNHINGVQFILFGQGTERFNGKNFGAVNGNDSLFFFHTFLWAFAPWSILTGWAVLNMLSGKMLTGKKWILAAPFFALLLIITLSGFKLPHYLNVIFPVSALMAANLILHQREHTRTAQWMSAIQGVMVIILLGLSAVLAAWLFPAHGTGMLLMIVLLLAVVFYFIKTKTLERAQKIVAVPVAATVLLFFMLNMHVYPRLLRYQGGNVLAAVTKDKIDPAAVYNWKDEYSSSYNFYTRHLTERFNDSLLNKGKTIWLLYDEKFSGDIEAAGYKVKPVYTVPAYRITQPSLSFLDPATRDAACGRLILGTIERK